MQTKPKVAIVLNSMWSIKDYILSGALHNLREAYDITAWVEKKFLENVRGLAKEIDLDDIEFAKYKQYKPNVFHRYVCKCQKSILFEYHDVQTEKIFQKRTGVKRLMQGRTSWQNVMSRIMHIIAKSTFRNDVDNGLSYLREQLTPIHLFLPELIKKGIDVVMTTDPIQRCDDSLYLAAKRISVPIVTLVLSWDNLTSKGRINDGFDRAMVWNELMKEEILCMYPSYGANQVKIVGYPRFDIYRRPLPRNFERRPFLEGLGLDPSKRILLFANSSTRSFAVQPQVIEHVHQAMMSGLLPQDTQLLIRCHPHDDLNIYEKFRNRPRVSVWPGNDRSGSQTLFNQMPRKDELLILAATMKHSAICINPGSSVMLDAAICDIPIICIAYDGDLILPRDQSYATCYDYSHQKPFHQIGATEICYSKEELIRSIQNALELGAGASSAVFTNYFRDASKFTTVEESPKWRERTLEALGSYTSYVTCLLASRCITTLDSEIVCHYDMDHTGYWDLVYVDGPTNIAPDGLLSVDGKTPHLANADVELFWKNGQYPHFIVVDGRRNTVRRFILSGSNYYHVLLKTDYLPRTGLFEALSFRYHTLLLRCLPSGQ